MQDLPNGGGGGGGGVGHRSKHWPPGAGDPRYATAWKAGFFLGGGESPPKELATPPQILSRLYVDNDLQQTAPPPPPLNVPDPPPPKVKTSRKPGILKKVPNSKK